MAIDVCTLKDMDEMNVSAERRKEGGKITMSVLEAIFNHIIRRPHTL